jgi:hypothetical protein
VLPLEGSRVFVVLDAWTVWFSRFFFGSGLFSRCFWIGFDTVQLLFRYYSVCFEPGLSLMREDPLFFVGEDGEGQEAVVVYSFNPLFFVVTNILSISLVLFIRRCAVLVIEGKFLHCRHFSREKKVCIREYSQRSLSSI